MCKCRSHEDRVHCGQDTVAGRKFLVRDVIQHPSCTVLNTPYCAKDARTEAEEVQRRIENLDCYAVPGAIPRQWSRFPLCKCEKYEHKVYCGATEVAERKFNIKMV